MLVYSLDCPLLSENALSSLKHRRRFRYRNLWNIGRDRASLRFDARKLYYLAPLLGLVGDQLSDVGRRAWKHRAAEVGEPCLSNGVGQDRVDPLVERIDNLDGCVLRSADPKHRTSLEAWHGFADSRHVGQGLRAHCSRHSQRA